MHLSVAIAGQLLGLVAFNVSLTVSLLPLAWMRSCVSLDGFTSCFEQAQPHLTDHGKLAGISEVVDGPVLGLWSCPPFGAILYVPRSCSVLLLLIRLFAWKWHVQDRQVPVLVLLGQARLSHSDKVVFKSYNSTLLLPGLVSLLFCPLMSNPPGFKSAGMSLTLTLYARRAGYIVDIVSGCRYRDVQSRIVLKPGTP
jgi:uncharacterized membrane protein